MITMTRTRTMAASIAAVAFVLSAATGCSLGVGKAPEAGDKPQNAASAAPAQPQDPATDDPSAEAEGGGAATDGEGQDAGSQDAGPGGASDSGSSGGEPGKQQAAALADYPETQAVLELPAKNIDEDPSATMMVKLHKLQRDGKMMTAFISFTVNSDARDHRDDLYGYLGNTPWLPYAVDTVNLNLHEVLRTSGNRLAQSAFQGREFSVGETYYAYATFAAPPEDVKTMDVSVVDGQPMFRGVEIQ